MCLSCKTLLPHVPTASQDESGRQAIGLVAQVLGSSLHGVSQSAEMDKCQETHVMSGS